MVAFLLVRAVLAFASVGLACANHIASSGRDATETSIWPIFQASPKNDYGRLSSHVAAQALHRHFSRDRGWRIEADNEVLHRALMKLNRGARGFSTGDLVEVAEAVGKTISVETSEHLAHAYKTCNISATASLGADDLSRILETYAESSILTAPSQSPSSSAVLATELRLAFDVQLQHKAITKQYTFKDALSVVEESVKRFGQQKQQTCLFKALPPSTCLSFGQYYAVCCDGLVEAVMSELEIKLQAPIVSPELLLRAVRKLSLPSISAQPCLSNQLVKQLHVIAEQNDNTVPLHGDDFSTWLLDVFSKGCAPSNQPSVAPSHWSEYHFASVRVMFSHIGPHHLARIVVFGLIAFTMLRVVLSQLLVACGAFHGADCDGKGAKRQ